MAIQENERKLAELILYVSRKLVNDPYFGQVKLNKVLFFSDFTAYGSWGQTITNAEYQHLPQGPTVHRMLPVQAELTNERAFAIQPTDCGGYTQRRPVNLRDPDLSLFSGAEIALVDVWIERLRPLTGTNVSKLSHETAGWQLTAEHEIIDPRMVFLSCDVPNAAEIQCGLQLAKKHNLLT